MAVQYAELGTEVEVGKLDGLQKRIPAQVVRFPFYDPEKTRPALVSDGPARAEFDFPLSWTGPDGIGASPFDEFAERRGAVDDRAATTPPWRCARRSGCSPPGSR